MELPQKVSPVLSIPEKIPLYEPLKVFLNHFAGRLRLSPTLRVYDSQITRGGLKEGKRHFAGALWARGNDVDATFMKPTLKQVLLLSAALGLSTGSLTAQEQSSSQSNPPPGSLARSSKVVGAKVFTQKGEHMGDISDVVFDPKTGQVAYAVLGIGGFLGVGEKQTIVPWNLVQQDPQNPENYVVQSDKQALRSAPSFEGDQWSTVLQPDYLKQVQAHFSGTGQQQQQPGTTAQQPPQSPEQQKQAQEQQQQQQAQAQKEQQERQAQQKAQAEQEAQRQAQQKAQQEAQQAQQAQQKAQQSQQQAQQAQQKAQQEAQEAQKAQQAAESSKQPGTEGTVGTPPQQ